MKEPTKEDFKNRGAPNLELYLYSSRILYGKYRAINNCRDWNYLLYRVGVKEDDQDYITLIKTSQHCYALTHYRVLDGFNEFKTFNRLFDVAQYIIAASEEFDRLYAEVLAERQAERERKRLERELKKANKKDSTV